MRKARKIAAILLAAFLFAAATYVSAWLLMPPRDSYGSTWESYLQEERDSIDVLFFGSSLVYCDVVPAVIREKTGLASYVMAGPEQTIPITYYYIREACRTQSPKAVAVELTGMFYLRYQNYTKVNIGYMPWSPNRLAATFRAAPPAERLGLLFPLYNYHDRWQDCTWDEVLRHLRPAADIYAGYTLLTEAREQTEITERDYSADTDAYRENLEYLGKISDYCAENGIRLILWIAPAMGRIPDAALAALESDVAGLGHDAFMDFNGSLDEMGIDPASDWYDFLHLNRDGAAKFSGYFSERLK